MNNMTDAALRQEGMRILLSNLGKVDAERFLALMSREPFDYTQWQSGLFTDMSVEQLSSDAMRYYSAKHPADEE